MYGMWVCMRLVGSRGPEIARWRAVLTRDWLVEAKLGCGFGGSGLVMRAEGGCLF